MAQPDTNLDWVDNIPEVDELIREYFLFRGYHKTQETFYKERKRDRTHGMQVNWIVQQLIVYIKDLKLDQYLEYWTTLEKRIFSKLPPQYREAIHHLDTALKRYFLVIARKKNQIGIMEAFFQKFGSDLISRPNAHDWMKWFALPHIRHPEKHMEFEAYFNKHWSYSVQTSLKNFLSTALCRFPRPKLLAFDELRKERASMKAEINTLKNRLKDADFLIRSLQIQLQFFLSSDPSKHPILEAIQNYECGIAINGIQINPDLPNPNPEILNIRQNNLSQHQPPPQPSQAHVPDGQQQTQDSLIKEKYFRSSLSPRMSGMSGISALDAVNNLAQRSDSNLTRSLNESNSNSNSRSRSSASGANQSDNNLRNMKASSLQASQSDPTILENDGDVAKRAEQLRSSPMFAASDRSTRSNSAQENQSSGLLPSLLRTNKDKDKDGAKDGSAPKEKGFNAHFSKFLRKIGLDELSSDEKQVSSQSSRLASKSISQAGGTQPQSSLLANMSGSFPHAQGSLVTASNASQAQLDAKTVQQQQQQQQQQQAQLQQQQKKDSNTSVMDSNDGTTSSSGNISNLSNIELKQSAIQLRTLIAPDPLIPIKLVRFNDSGTRLLYCNANGKIAIYNCNTGHADGYFIPQLMQTLQVDANQGQDAQHVVDVEWDSSRSDEALLVATAAGEVQVWALGKKENKMACEAKIALAEFAANSGAGFVCARVGCLAVSRSSQSEHNFVASCHNDRGESVLYLFGYLPGTGKYTILFGSDVKKCAITAMTFNHNGKLLITGAEDGVIRIFDVNDKFPELTAWEAHGSGVVEIQLCGDANSVLSFAKDYCVRHWGLMSKNTCKKKWVLSTEMMDDAKDPKNRKDGKNEKNEKNESNDRDEVLCLALGPDNYFAVSNGKDKNGKYTVMLYNINDSNTNDVVAGAHSGVITNIEWHRDNKMLATASIDGTLQIYGVF